MRKFLVLAFFLAQSLFGQNYSTVNCSGPFAPILEPAAYYLPPLCNATNPSSIAGLYLWLNARTSVTQSGGIVSAWPDLSGNSFNLTPTGTGVTAPSYDATFLDQPTITFDGVDNQLNRIGLGGTTRTAYTVVQVLQPVVSGDQKAIWYMPNNVDFSLETNGMYSESISTQNYDTYVQGTGPIATSTAGASFLDNRPVIMATTYDGSNVTTYINDIQQSTAAAAGKHIGNNLALAGLNPAFTGSNWNGKISESVWYSRALNTQELTQLYTYEKRSWFSSLWSQNSASFYFNGTDTKLDGGTTSIMDFPKSQPLTVSVWLRVPATDTVKRSFLCREKVTANFTGYDNLIMTGGTIMWYMNGTGVYGLDTLQVRTTTSIPDDGINFVNSVTTYDGSGVAAGVHIYFQGIEQPLHVDLNNLSTESGGLTLPFEVGDALNGLTFYKGDMNNLAVFNQVYSPSDINTYIRPSGYPGDLTGAPGLIHWWQLARTYGTTPDSITTVYDRVNTNAVNLTVDGTAAITAATPSLR